MSRPFGPRHRRCLLLVLLAALVAGCATVPGSSEVSVLRRVGDAGEPTAPPGPARGAGPLETVRGWINASGASADRHAAARQFLTAATAGAWDDGAAPVVVADRVDTVFAPSAPSDAVSVRIRGSRLGTLTPAGAFVAQPAPVEVVVGLVEASGQWRISSLPAGTLVRVEDLRANTRPVRTWFDGEASGLPVSETRYLQIAPSRSLPARAVDLLAAGPSAGLAGAAASPLPPSVMARADEGPDTSGTLTVDLTGLGDPDPGRRARIARQVVLTLAGIGVPRVRLLADGRPLLADRPELGVSDVLVGVPPDQRERRDLPLDATGVPPGDARQPAPVPPGDGAARDPAVLADGRVRPLVGPGDLLGGSDPEVVAAALGPDDRIAVVAREPGGQRLLIGRVGAPLAGTEVAGTSVSAPTWESRGTAVWVVVDGTRVVRVSTGTGPALPGAPEDAADAVPGVVTGVDAPDLLRLGPPTAIRLSPDGARLAAVVGGRVAVGVVVPTGGGPVVRGGQVLRPDVGTPAAVDGVLDAAWLGSERLVAVGTRTGHPVQIVSVDGLDLSDVPTVNLTPPVTAVAAGRGRPLVVADQSGLWSLDADGTGVWRSLPGAPPGAVPLVPG